MSNELTITHLLAKGCFAKLIIHPELLNTFEFEISLLQWINFGVDRTLKHQLNRDSI